MSSILTNNSAMVALQNLKSINMNLADTQSAISTGKDISKAKDNSAVWAISKVMESDVRGFEAISDSLSLGESTVSVAAQAADTITDLLTQMKGKIVAAQEDNVDRDKLHTDVEALRNQISSVVGAAQFNGLNLIDGSAAQADILSSLDRDSTGGVTSSKITVAGQNLSIGQYVAKNIFGGSDEGVSGTGDLIAFTLSNDAVTKSIKISDSATYEKGDKISLKIGDETVSHTVTTADLSGTTHDIIAVSLKTQIDALGINGLNVTYSSADPGKLSLENAVPPDTQNLSITGHYRNENSGGLGALTGIDVSDKNAAGEALINIEALIDTAIDAAAAFGSSQKQLETQSKFIDKMTDSLKSGIGGLVDADLEETSARLQALQVQQQLGVQALSIANQAPQSIMSLFR